MLSLALGVLATLAPKCPLCLAAYLSIVGVGVAGATEVVPFLFPAGVALLAFSLVGAVFALKRFSERPRPPRQVGGA